MVSDGEMKYTSVYLLRTRASLQEEEEGGFYARDDFSLFCHCFLFVHCSLHGRYSREHKRGLLVVLVCCCVVKGPFALWITV
ncbi:hypothetical protein N656DRAFT_220018 [Canariomyces notabilis]|uniref:Uncharacterized protein n=1 Tax=Canariomyces notabilis TaxID=2074819 RepID=A0AAN6TL09_9PEZI|nr:hypothetical protein N656DRAFT_220018 [Canariomyces arenarius]